MSRVHVVLIKSVKSPETWKLSSSCSSSQTPAKEDNGDEEEDDDSNLIVPSETKVLTLPHAELHQSKHPAWTSSDSTNVSLSFFIPIFLLYFPIFPTLLFLHFFSPSLSFFSPSSSPQRLLGSISVGGTHQLHFDADTNDRRVDDEAAGGAAGVSTGVDRVCCEMILWESDGAFVRWLEQRPPRMLRCGFILMSLFLLQLPELLYYKQALCEQLSGSRCLSGLTATPASCRTLSAAGWECCLCNVSAEDDPPHATFRLQLCRSIAWIWIRPPTDL